MIRLAVRSYRLLAFAVYYVRVLVRANIVVAWEVITPGDQLAPGVVTVPLRSRGWFEITSISNLISLTPGTLTVGVRGDPPLLVVHGMHAADPEAFRAELLDLERRMLVALGRIGPAEGTAARGEGVP
ncbi:MAG TPA: Na+/H+ antiporter subunit E [Jiangellaceae bacterium]|nr:Na+/H+ antiporter subunit E [Jiangellaceae bacterium]